MEKQFHVYILASQQNGTLYIGVTSNLIARIHQHKSNAVAGFTKEYDVKLLVHFETFEDSISAITREKTLKHWPRQKKLRLIEASNPLWRDLYETLF